MKSISAAIVVSASLATLVAGSFVRHGDTGVFVMACGFFATLLGLGVWIKAISAENT